MLSLFRKSNGRYRRYNGLFKAWEGYLLTHKKDVVQVSEVATVQAMTNFSPIAETYGLPQIHDPARLVACVKPQDIYEASERCFVNGGVYRQEGSERFYQGAVLAGLYFGLAGLVVEKERFVGGLWSRVRNAMSLAVELAARSSAHHLTPEKASLSEPPLHPKTMEALTRTNMTEKAYRKIDNQRAQEIADLEASLQKIFQEQQQLFAEIERASESVSPTHIYAALTSVLSILERVLARRAPAPAGLGEPKLVAADVTKFINRLYVADDRLLGQMEALSTSLVSKQHSPVSLLGAKATRVIILGHVLHRRLERIAPLCATEAQWLATTLLTDLEKLSASEVRQAHPNVP